MLIPTTTVVDLISLQIIRFSSNPHSLQKSIDVVTTQEELAHGYAVYEVFSR